MTRRLLPRRDFLAGAAAAAKTALSTQFLPAGEPRKNRPAVRLGGPVFVNSKDPEELALAHRKLGYYTSRGQK